MPRVNPRPPARLRAPRRLDDLLLYRLSRLLATGGHAVIRLCEGRYGITRREWRVLSLLAEQPGMLSSSELALRAQLDRARTSRAITSLVAKRLVRREAGPGDRRQVRLSLTPAGQSLHDELFPQVAAVNRDLLAVLDEGEAAALQAALDRLQSRADELHQAAAALPKADRRRGRTRRALG
ncbi:MarR family winged helix-turn-helix transcriptional regulator [Ramlibacter humi]|uniref:MarR family transcriptional regulator n=1 Tax=Ramlibacter humi TaxID=2530451 RepID=A0A4Z0C056_9BURK|nr:MarR family transcriptional regulator [Ramlibacter humi]TFZ03928.1 MarR family transcriptional regulator [Ramlibacter humi]